VTAATAEDDGGSSPLVPILIAIGVLAAISLGVVWFRRQRSTPGDPVSSKAS
jgi:MYXO-CTERM domain-containing protein